MKSNGRRRDRPIAARTLALGLLCWALLGPSPAAAQEEAPAAAAEAPAEEEKKEPQAVPVGEIPARAKAVEEHVAKLEADLAESALEDGVEAALPETASEIRSHEERLERVLARTPTQGELDSQDSRWQGLDAQLSRQARGLADRANDFEARMGEVGELTEIWSRTRDAASEASAPPAVLKSVSTVLNRLRAAQRTIETSRNRSLELASRVADQLAAVTAARERIQASRSELQASLLVRQKEPLWSARLGGESLDEELAATRESLAEIGPAIQAYAMRNRTRVLFHALLIAALVAAMRRGRAALARRASSDTSPEQRTATGSPLDALAHPWAAALTLGIALTFVLHRSAPPAFTLVLGLVQLPAWLVVLRRMLPTPLHPPLYGLALLAWADVARTYLQPFQALNRLLVIALLVGAVAGIVRMRQPSRLGQIASLISGRFWLRVLDAWLRLGLWTLAAALVAAVLGYSNLADILTAVLIRGSYVGTMLFAAVRIAEASIEAAVADGSLDRLRIVRNHREQVVAAVSRGLRVVGFTGWIVLLLQRASLLDPFRNAAGNALSAQVGYGAFSFSLGGLLAFLLTLWISWRLGRFVSFALNEEVFPRMRLPSGVPYALSNFSRYTVLVLGFLIAIATLGFSMDRVTLMVSALGVGIGFGLQNLVNNFVSGIMLLFERPVRVGDSVQLDDLIGLVTHIGIRASKVRTFDGADVIVPNGDFVSARVINWTLADKKRRVILPVGVAYGTKPRQVLEILLRIAGAHPEVLDHPEPEALFKGFGDSSLDFEIRAWTQSERGWPAVRSDLALAVQEALEEADIEIPFPQRDLHLRSVDPGARQALARSEDPEED